MSGWMNDEREIIAVMLAANPARHFGIFNNRVDGDEQSGPSRFERFERPGEYCHLPWIRIFSPTGNVLEAPLTQVKLLSYKPEGAAG
jgi:hypothetical protein